MKRKMLISVPAVRAAVFDNRSKAGMKLVYSKQAKRKEEYFIRHPLYPRLIVDTRTIEEAAMTCDLENRKPKFSRKERNAKRGTIARLGKDSDGAYRVFNRLDGRK